MQLYNICTRNCLGLYNAIQLRIITRPTVLNDIFLNPALENMSLFADDAADHHTSKNIQKISSKLQIKPTSVNQWCEINRMKMSIEKTKIMLIGSRKKLNRISESEKYIKLLIDNTPI